MKKFEEALYTYFDFMTERLEIRSVDRLLLSAIAEGLGEGVIFHPDASLVACSDKAERDRVKKDFLIGTLKLADGPALDKAIESVCVQMGSSNRKKYRVVFYYLLLEKLEKKDFFNSINPTPIPTSSLPATSVATPEIKHAALPMEMKNKTNDAKDFTSATPKTTGSPNPPPAAAIPGAPASTSAKTSKIKEDSVSETMPPKEQTASKAKSPDVDSYISNFEPVLGTTTPKEHPTSQHEEMDVDSYISTFETVSPKSDHHFTTAAPIGDIATGAETPFIETSLLGKEARSVLSEIEVSAPQQSAAEEKTPAPATPSETKKMETIDQSLTVYGEYLRDDLGVYDVRHDLLRALAQSLGTGILKGEGALIACNSPEERERIKHNFLQNRLHLSNNPDLDEAIDETCQKMSDKNKPTYRVVFYYLLTRRFHREHVVLSHEYAGLF